MTGGVVLGVGDGMAVEGVDPGIITSQEGMGRAMAIMGLEIMEVITEAIMGPTTDRPIMARPSDPTTIEIDLIKALIGITHPHLLITTINQPLIATRWMESHASILA